MSRPVEADREADIEVDEDAQICSPYHNRSHTLRRIYYYIYPFGMQMYDDRYQLCNWQHPGSSLGQASGSQVPGACHILQGRHTPLAHLHEAKKRPRRTASRRGCRGQTAPALPQSICAFRLCCTFACKSFVFATTIQLVSTTSQRLSSSSRMDQHGTNLQPWTSSCSLSQSCVMAVQSKHATLQRLYPG